MACDVSPVAMFGDTIDKRLKTLLSNRNWSKKYRCLRREIKIRIEISSLSLKCFHLRIKEYFETFNNICM